MTSDILLVPQNRTCTQIRLHVTDFGELLQREALWTSSFLFMGLRIDPEDWGSDPAHMLTSSYRPPSNCGGGWSVPALYLDGIKRQPEFECDDKVRVVLGDSDAGRLWGNQARKVPGCGTKLCLVNLRSANCDSVAMFR